VIVIDEARDWGGHFNQRWGPSAHLLSDLLGEEGTRELVEFVVALGIPAVMIQHAGGYREHFDLAGPWLDAAHAAGAMQVDRYTLVAILRRKRRWLALRTPPLHFPYDRGLDSRVLMASDPIPPPNTSDLPIDALTVVLNALRPLDQETRRRVLAAASALVPDDVPPDVLVSAANGNAPIPRVGPPPAPSALTFSGDRTPSARDFLLEKKPRTDVDRVVCLAYYMAHYRNAPEFETVDLSLANTEAAQRKFSNAAHAVNTAVKHGLLALTSDGRKCLSVVGERYVQQLPDYESARAALQEYTQRGRR